MKTLNLCLCVMLLLPTVNAKATDSDMDTTFGSDFGAGGGQEVLCFECPNGPPPPSGDTLATILPSPGGVYTLVGSVANDSTGGPVVAFASISSSSPTGVTQTVTTVHATPNAAAQDASGRVVVVTDSTVTRFKADFSADASFGTAGTITVSIPGYDNLILRAVAIDHAQRIVVAGSVNSASGNVDIVVARLLPAGTYDNAFAATGRQIIGFDLGAMGHDGDFAESVVVAADDGLLLAGVAGNLDPRGGFGELALVRLKADGSLDNAFNGGGKRAIDVGNPDNLSMSAKFDHAGRILAASQDRMIRLLANGLNDSTFLGSTPTSTPGVAPVNFTLRTFAERSDGRLILAGSSLVSGNSVFTVARLLPDGGDDNQFNAGSNMRDIAFGAPASPNAIVVDAGRPVIAGNWFNTGFSLSRWCVARLQSDLIFANRSGD